MKQCKPTKTWARTGHRNLLKHQQSGNYYARTFAGGKEIWKSLKTSHRSVAEARLAEFVKDHRKRIGNGGENSAKMTFDQAAKIHLPKTLRTIRASNHEHAIIGANVLSHSPKIGKG